MMPAGGDVGFRKLRRVLFLMCLFFSTNAVAETLQQALDAALAVDRGLKAARENTAAAASLLDAAKSARLPGVSLEAGYTALSHAPAAQAELFGTSVRLPLAQKESRAYRAATTLPLYTSGRIRSGIDSATALLDAAQLGEAGNAQDLRLRVAEAYVTVLRAMRGFAVAESHVASLAAHARDVGNLHEQGLVARNDLLSAGVSLADARQKAIQEGNGLDLAHAAYNRLLGRPLDQAVSLVELLPETADDPLPALTERALAQRTELAALAQQIRALRHQASGVRAETAPQVALNAGYGFQENRRQVHEEQWSATLGLRWSLFDGGVTRYRAGAVERQAAALAEQQDELASLIALQVRQAWLDVQETRQRTGVTQSAIAQAQENLRVVRDRYANGLSTHTEVLDAETLRVNSETNHARAIYDAVLAGLRLKRATGAL